MVTGAGGFLGSHICRYFGRSGHPVAAVGRLATERGLTADYPGLDLLAGMTLPDPAFVRAVTNWKPDLLVHAAASARVAASAAEPYTDFQESVDLCAYALDTVRKHAPNAAFVLLSSAAVYGNPSDLPIHEGTRLAPLSPYGYHKWLCELLVDEYRSLFGVRASSLRIFSAYGEGLRRQVVHDLCTQMLEGTEPIRVFGTGRETRDFVHANDVARAIEYVANAPAGSPPCYNVASGRELRIDELARTLASAVGCQRPLVFTDEQLPGYPTHWRADIARLAALGYRAEVRLEAGLADYARWLKTVRSTRP